MNGTLFALANIFSKLSLLAFGGGNTILPEMQRQVVVLQHWMTAREFSAMFALAQAAPGPNMMIVTLIGWRVAGWPGVLVTSLAKFGPSSLLTAITVHHWQRFKNTPWQRVVQAGLQPITAGLVCSSALLIAHASDHTWGLAVITIGCAGLAWKTRAHPLLLLAAGAVLGMVGGGWLSSS